MLILADYLGDTLSALGRKVGTHTWWCIVVSTFVALLFSTGTLRGRYETSMEKLFTDMGGQAMKAWKFQDEHFPVKYSSFQPDRLPHVPAMTDIIFLPKIPNMNMLAPGILLEIRQVEAEVRNLTFMFMEREFSYEDVCAKWNDSCYETALTKLLRVLDFEGTSEADDGEEGVNFPDIDWPMYVTDPLVAGVNYEEILLPEAFGSVVSDGLEGDGIVRSVGAIKSTFYLSKDGEFSTRLSRAWQAKFTEYVQHLNASGRLNHTNALFNEDSRVDRLFAELPLIVITSRLPATIIALIVFSMLAFMTSDWVTSKPLLGILGVMCSGLSIGTTFGALQYAGMEYSALLAGTPFLTLGVGMDDALVLVAAWHMTDAKLPVPERLAAAYREAALGITLTTLTDIISFAVGTTIPFRGLSDFCAFTALAMATTYLYTLFFFGAFLALSGRYEEQGRHCLTVKVKSASETDDGPKTCCISSLMANVRDFGNQLRSVYVEAIGSWTTRVFICTSFLAYLGGAIYGVASLKTVVNVQNGVPVGDPYIDYINALEGHFLDYPPTVQVMLGGNLDYSDKKVQKEIEYMLQTLENSVHFRDSLYTQSWLRGFLSHAQDAAAWGDSSLLLNITKSEEQFVDQLSKVYLHGHADLDSLDLHIENGKIKASRFLLQPAPISSASSFSDIVLYLQNLFQENFRHLDVHHTSTMHMRFGEPPLNLWAYTMSSLGWSSLGICSVTFLLAPQAASSFLVCGTIVSIMTGLIGYFQLLGQNYDDSTMQSVVMSIGFSVDYSAHFAFVYTAKQMAGQTPAKKLDHTLQAVGLPILLGAATSFISLSGLMKAPSQSYETFFRILVGVFVLGLYHGLVVVPVLLAMADDGVRCVLHKFSTKDDQKVEKKERHPTDGHLWSKNNDLSFVLPNGINDAQELQTNSIALNPIHLNAALEEIITSSKL